MTGTNLEAKMIKDGARESRLQSKRLTSNCGFEVSGIVKKRHAKSREYDKLDNTFTSNSLAMCEL